MSKAVPHPSTVGNSFVKQYYQLLATSPETLHRFYKDDSKFTHGCGSQEATSISGQKNINGKILSMNLKGASVDLESGSVDCQTSLDGGVLVMVSGLITLMGQEPQPFVQTFFLAVQPNGYFVLNDAFRYLDMPKSSAFHVATALVTSPVSKTTTATQMSVTSPSMAHTPPSSPMLKSPPHPPLSASPAKGSGAAASSVEPPQQSLSPKSKPTATPVDSTVTSPKKSAESDESDESPSTNDDGGPKSWASHLFAAKAAAATAQRKTAQPPTSTTSNQPHSHNSKKKSGKESNSSSSTHEQNKRRQVSVLIIRDIPPNTKENDLRDLFKEFGNITAVNVVSNRGHAFVDFDSMDGVRAALSGNKHFTLYDKPLVVEEKYADRQGGNNGNSGRGGGYREGGRGGSGRGGRYNGGSGLRSQRMGGSGGRGRRQPGGRSSNSSSTAAAPTSQAL